ncbi:Suppressor protein stp22 of temperature-sensitive alpha-factor receptor and arginine permease [Sorochytrium milnesiophthora]
MAEQKAWLRQATASYQHSQRVTNDIEQALTRYTALLPKLDTYIHEDGTSSLLLCLYGTVAIAFNGSTYNIPLDVWIPHLYPVVPPFGFVRPTNNMEVQPGQHVDTNGKLYHPYLSTWHLRVEQSSLVEMLSIFASIFSQQPPVYSKLTSPTSSTSASQRPQPAARPLSAAGHSPAVNQQSPRLFPSPRQSFTPPTAMQPNGISSSMPSPSTSIMNAQIPVSSSQPLPPPLDPAAMKLASIKASVHAKLQQKFERYSAEMSNSMQLLLNDNKMLNESDMAIANAQRTFVEEEIRLKRLIEDLQARIADVTKSVETLKTLPEVNVDEVYRAPIAPYNQLFDAVADDLAIDDAIYYLGKALDKEHIDATAYMKARHIRALAKEQFLRRALIKKIRTAARLKPLEVERVRELLTSQPTLVNQRERLTDEPLQCDDEGSTLLDIAVAANDVHRDRQQLQLVDLLTSLAGFELGTVSFPVTSGHTALHTLAKQGDEAVYMLDLLIRNVGADAVGATLRSAVDIHGSSALHVAACYGNLLMLQYVDSFVGSGIDDMSLLCAAVQYNQAAVLRYLLLSPRHRQQSAASDSSGQTVLHLAAATGQEDLCRLLLRHGDRSVLHLRDAFGKTPADLAVSSLDALCSPDAARETRSFLRRAEHLQSPRISTLWDTSLRDRLASAALSCSMHLAVMWVLLVYPTPGLLLFPVAAYALLANYQAVEGFLVALAVRTTQGREATYGAGLRPRGSTSSDGVNVGRRNRPLFVRFLLIVAGGSVYMVYLNVAGLASAQPSPRWLDFAMQITSSLLTRPAYIVLTVLHCAVFAFVVFLLWQQALAIKAGMSVSQFARHPEETRAPVMSTVFPLLLFAFSDFGVRRLSDDNEVAKRVV